MQRLRLYDCRNSRLPSTVGLCVADAPGVARYVNSAQQRLLFAKEAGEEGWWGTFAEMAFTVSRTQPYLTLPREVARLEYITACNNPVPIQNQFYEYLDFGNGRFPKTRVGCSPFPQLVAYSRNNVTTFTDMTNAPQKIAIYAADPGDVGAAKRVLIQGLDANGMRVYSQDGLTRVEGIFVTLDTPFAITPISFSSITGIQKDATLGAVQFFQVDPTTGAQVLIHTMDPGELTASYRRYYLNSLPLNCCDGLGSSTTVQLTAIAKLELIPVQVDTDYCLIQNLEALIEECQAVRYSEIDTPVAKQMAQEKHMQAIRLLVGELGHYLGIDQPATVFAPFGSAKLERLKIGMI